LVEKYVQSLQVEAGLFLEIDQLNALLVEETALYNASQVALAASQVALASVSLSNSLAPAVYFIGHNGFYSIYNVFDVNSMCIAMSNIPNGVVISKYPNVGNISINYPASNQFNIQFPNLFWPTNFKFVLEFGCTMTFASSAQAITSTFKFNVLSSTSGLSYTTDDMEPYFVSSVRGTSNTVDTLYRQPYFYNSGLNVQILTCNMTALPGTVFGGIPPVYAKFSCSLYMVDSLGWNGNIV